MQNRPLPVPPNTQPKTYGPSSSFTPGMNAHEALYGKGAFNPPLPVPEWAPYMSSPTTGMGSTFFASKRFTRKPLNIAGARPFDGIYDVPVPPQNPYSPGNVVGTPKPVNQNLYKPPPTYPPPTDPASMQATKVPLGNTSQIMVHSGFWQILQTTGSRFLDVAVASGFIASNAPAPPELPPISNEPIQKKRVSVNMISRPTGFSHVAHASTFEEAEYILRKWQADRVGKQATPAWVLPIKEAARARARVKGIAEVHANRPPGVEQPGGLRVTNGFSSIKSQESTTNSTEAVENDSILVPPSPAFLGGELTRVTSNGTMVLVNEDGTGTVRVKIAEKPGIDGLPRTSGTEGLVDDLPSKPIKPSLTTLEKATSTRIYLETHYHSILRVVPGRDERKLALEKELVRLNISDSEKREIRRLWKESETAYLREVRRRVGVSQFVKLKTIGHGAFGVVSLVSEKGTGEIYAMKQLRKADMLKKGQEGHVRAERDLLASASSATRWTVRLAYSFQDADHLYLVMTYMAGGDLLSLLIEKDIFEEDFARFYMAEMVLAVEETHKVLGAIHRDIKPDNFLFDKNGHIAISDFGLATDFHWAHDAQYFEEQRQHLLRKHGIDVDDGSHAPHTSRFDQERFVQAKDDAPGSILTWRDKHRRRLAYSVVGTNNYMPVEVLRGNGYDQSCDWWSLGIILFEMLYGYPPFVSKTRVQTRQKIMNWRQALRFPSRPHVSREAQDLIQSLICEKEDRIGSRSTASVSRPNSVVMAQRHNTLNAAMLATANRNQKGIPDGASEIKAHPWFKGIDWANLHRQTPPFVPDLKDEVDTRYFEDNIDDNPLPPPEAAPGAPPAADTRDPLLRDKVNGPNILNVRKQTAFQGWTFKGQRNKVFDPRQGIVRPKAPQPTAERGRSSLRVEGGSFVRSLSI